MKKPDYVYVSYIAAAPEKIWQAFIDTDMMKEYWIGPGSDCSRVNVSDWRLGSKWEHQRVDGSGIVDIVGKVVEFAPPHRMVLTWARPSEADDETKHSRVSIDIEALEGGTVRLTVAHDGLDEQMLAGISGGWPKVLSNLKTLLETGKPLPRALKAG